MSGLDDKKPPMRFLSTAQAQKARKAKEQPKVEVRRIEVKHGIMHAVCYPGTGSVLIETDSGIRIALKYEEAQALKDLLNAQLPESDPAAKKDEDDNG